MEVYGYTKELDLEVRGRKWFELVHVVFPRQREPWAPTKRWKLRVTQ